MGALVLGIAQCSAGAGWHRRGRADRLHGRRPRPHDQHRRTPQHRRCWWRRRPVLPPFAGSKYVVDVSGKKLVAGVLAVQSLADLPEAPHLLISAHLLEHLPDPVTFVRSLREVISADGHLYIEVPLDRPRVGRWHATTAYDRFLGLVRRTRPTWILADFATGAARNVGWPVPWPGAVKQSEHINYFSERSLTALLSNAGFRVTQVRSDPGASLRGLRLGTLAVLAVPI